MPPVQQLVDIDIATIQGLNGVVEDNDDNGILSAGDRVNGVLAELSDLESSAAQADYLSLTLDRRIDIYQTSKGISVLLASQIDDNTKLEFAYRVARWGYCEATYRNVGEFECVSEDAKYDPDYVHSDAYRDLTRDVQLYSALAFIGTEQAYAEAMAKVTDPKARSIVEYTVNSGRGYIFEGNFLPGQHPKKWTNRDNVAVSRASYLKQYQLIQAAWNARTLTWEGVANLQNNYSNLARLEQQVK